MLSQQVQLPHIEHHFHASQHKLPEIEINMNKKVTIPTASLDNGTF